MEIHMFKTVKFALAAALIGVTSIALVDSASAATRHHRSGWQSSPVALSNGYASGGAYSGAQRTDSAPITGGGY